MGVIMEKKVLVETSARHVHVSEETLKVLFGENAQLTVKKMLSQPGQYACEERVTVVGPKKSLPGVSILGPFRKASQVELSATDCRSIGLGIAVKESGDIAGTPGCILQGPCGEVELKEGVIVAKRHIHLTPDAAAEFGVEDKEVVGVKVESDGRSLIFGDVVCRVHPNFAPAMHIDTDESNAAFATPGMMGEIVKL
jgi:putative phosphotransacetylase